MKRHQAIFAVLTAAAMSMPIAAPASDGQNACMGDAMKTCWSAIPDHHAVYLCLYKNQSQLSEPCRAIISRTQPYDMDQSSMRHSVRQTWRHYPAPPATTDGFGGGNN
jgi:hypothetical protein